MLGGCWSLVLAGGGELGRELLASGDVELLEGVPEVCLDGALGDEQTLGDLTVRLSRGGKAGDAKLAGG